MSYKIIKVSVNKLNNCLLYVLSGQRKKYVTYFYVTMLTRLHIVLLYCYKILHCINSKKFLKDYKISSDQVNKCICLV